MSDSPAQSEGRRSPLLVYACVAVLAAAAGFAAVYVSLAPTGNDARPAAPAGQTSAPSAPAAPAREEPGERQGLAAYATGHMAAFVARNEPQDLPEAAFATGEGAPVTLADWNGQVVLLNLWATWCAPCREEMPALDRLKAALDGEPFDVVAVSVDLGSADKPRAFLEEIGVQHLKLYHEPTARLGPRLKAIGMPTTLLIGRDGREIGRLVGPAEWDAPEAVALIRAALAAGS